MKLLQEFKTFAMRGNVADMAVGIIIGAAFGRIVNSLVNDILMPPLGMIVGRMDFTHFSIVLKEAVIDPATGAVLTPAVTVSYGMFINAVINFLIVAFAAFLFVKAVNSMVRKETAAAPPSPPPPTPTRQEELLTEIRNLLKAR